MKYIINWPSGAGGDFILSLIYSYIDPNFQAKCLPRLNLWQCDSDMTLPYRTFKYFDDAEEQQETLDNMPDGCTLQTHTLADIPLEYDENTAVINIYTDDLYVETYLGFVHKLKTEVLDHDINDGLRSDNFKLPETPNHYNIDYVKLFGKQDEETIKLLFSLYNIDDYDMSEVKSMLKSYHDKNERVLRVIHISELIDRGLNFIIYNRNQMLQATEAGIGKTLNEQHAIVYSLIKELHTE